MPAESAVPARPARWTSLLHGAGSEAHVVSIVREYLLCWRPSELVALPVAVDSARIATGQDVSDLAVELTQAELKFEGDAHATAALREITSVVREAAARFPRFPREARPVPGDPK